MGTWEHGNYLQFSCFSSLPSQESYLSAGEMTLPHMFFLFTVLYAICLFIWIRNIRLIKEGKPSLLDSGEPVEAAASTPVGRGAQMPGVTVYPIHYLMGSLLTLKFLSLLFESIRYHYLRVTGKTVFWSSIYYTFAFLKVRMGGMMTALFLIWFQALIPVYCIILFWLGL